MPFTNLHMEDIEIPKEHREIILNNYPLTPELEAQGFGKGRAPIYWIERLKGVWLGISQDDNNSSEKLEYRFTFFTTGEVFGEYDSFITKWAAENNHEEKKKNYQWGEWFYVILSTDECLDKTEDLEINAPDKGNSTYIYTSSLEVFNRARIVLSEGLRSLSGEKMKEIEQLFIAAETDSDMIEECTNLLYEKPQKMACYRNLWQRTDAIIKAHGVNADTVPLLAAVCGVPSPGLKKKIATLCAQHDVKQALEADEELAESLFYELQTHIGGYFTDQLGDRPTKALVKKVANMLAAACEAFGFGVYPDSILTIIRLFEHDTVEGIGLNWYKSDAEFDADDFIESGDDNGRFYDDTFWEEVDIATLIGIRP